MSSDSDSDVIKRFREDVRTEEAVVRLSTGPFGEQRYVSVSWGIGFVMYPWQNTALQAFGDRCGETILERHDEDGIVPSTEVLELIDDMFNDSNN